MVFTTEATQFGQAPQPRDNAPSGGFLAAVRQLMPGIIAGAADLDPAAVLTATVVGATFGLSIAWVVLISFPVLKTVFAVSSRIGRETRRGLIELVRIRYGSGRAKIMALGMVVVNLAMVIGDIYAVSDAFSLILLQRRAMFIAVVGFVIWYFLIVSDYKKVTRTLGSLTLVLLAYILAAHRATDSYGHLLHGVFLPHMRMTGAYFMAAIALFGSLLTPDVIVWQTSTKRDLPTGVASAHYTESQAGTIVACLISFCVIICASRLHVADPAQITTRTAAEALNVLGQAGPVIFSLGIIGSGLVALPLIVGSLCFSVAEAFGWKSRLSRAPWEATRFYTLISAVVVIAVAVDMFGINVVSVLYWSQLFAGVLTIPILHYMRKLGDDPALVSVRNTRAENGWLRGALVVTVIANLAFLWTQFVH
jgi:Mn2+/Fe2+ NRAMP family transporter